MWTEEEARKLRCCGPDGCGSGLRNKHDIYERWCIASACMAWRHTTYFKNSKTGEVPMKQGAYKTGTAAENGYCGLAGHPFPVFDLPRDE